MAINRIVCAEARGERIDLSSDLAGVAGSSNAVTLEFTFDSAWEGTTKMVYLVDALGQESVCVMLTTNLLKLGESDVWQLPIPAEPLREPGAMKVIVRGVTLAEDGVTAARVILTAETRLFVLPAEVPERPAEPQDPTADRAEQLQAEIDAIRDDVAAAAQAADAKEDARAAQAAAEAARDVSAAASEKAQSAETGAEAARQGAEDACRGAQDACQDAQAAKQAIEGLTVAAQSGPAGSEAAVEKGTAANGSVALRFTIPRGEQGRTGEPGTGIVATEMEGADRVRFNYSDGGSFTTGSLRGARGEPGRVGPAGPQGEKGEKGDKGDDGAVLDLRAGVFAMSINEAGHLILAVNVEEEAPPMYIDPDTGHLIYEITG